MSQPLLFNTIPFLQIAATTDAKVRRAMEVLTPEHFEDATAEELADKLYISNRLLPVSLQVASATQTYPQEVQVVVDDETAPQGKRLADGRRFCFSIPYSGNKDMLQVLATTASAPPFGEAKDYYIYFTLEQVANGNVEDIIVAYNLNKNRLAANATALGQNIEAYNASLQQMISSGVAARQARLQKDVADAESIGVPFAA